MTIVTTFPESEFRISRVEQEKAVHAEQAVGLQMMSADLTTSDGVCTLTTVWA